ncbi:aminotransferase class I/II-fold pyridoxal phosphate-dependent enzyme [Pseudorhodoferax soli]|uniref:L-seryl-tRNA(Ser) seleniumtransferase n=1 Tax=Pseudorhodoferax soli TaxID=545864 RepID=A0A368XJC2_9BURK|nr:aminotransferase class I/II-fold pyridoxal phosphate-dependent enzyme [Pseudorhodoferax soli]RCW66134.1 L-seryl-tRNA(Ser) seleniumtransferase [Pseudorhodoferax soli]
MFSQAPSSPSQPVDRFGNPIDASVGYARGDIIRSSVQEAMRLRQGQRLATARVLAKGPESIAVFTGNQRDFPIRPDDLAGLCEEWVGPGIIANELNAVAIEHMGGRSGDQVAVFNRTSAGIIATIAGLSDGRPVVSFVPRGGRSHASVIRGCGICGSKLIEIDNLQDLHSAVGKSETALVVITTVTSSLESLDAHDIERAVEVAQRSGAIAFLDDAYGARIRPVLHGGRKGLEFGADLSITNCDKAGLSGPRAGVLVGRPAAVTRAQAKGAEFGMEARAPIVVGALRSLQRYSPGMLLEEARAGKELSEALAAKLGPRVARSDLGPVVDENDVLAMLLERSGAPSTSVVPAEAAAALGMVLLRDHGILTTNTHGQPGARVSLRFKPTLDALPRMGGVPAVVDAVLESLATLAPSIGDADEVAELILGASQ